MSEAEMPADRPAATLGVPGSRALIVGTGSHVTGSRLPDVPAVGRTVSELGRVLVERCGMQHVREHVDPTTPKAFLRPLVEEAEQAEDVFLFYYVGHGLVSPGGELYLATHGTEDDGIGLAVDALSYATVREALTECPARSIMVVLDCCFSGRASGSFGTAVADAFELTYIRGSFLLSSASATEQALAPEGETYTAFSSELVRLLREGDPTAPRNFTFEDAYRHLARTLPARGLPAPHRRAGDRAGELILATNPAAPPVTVRRPPATPEAAGQSADQPCPYRGLDAFTVDDSGYFFGRSRLVADILGRLAEQRDAAGPVAVVGRSGSGKSSLLQAGVLPAIRAGRLRIPSSRTWPHLVITPGEHPLRTLANRLAQPATTPAAAIHEQLLTEPRRLTDIVRTALRHHAGERDIPDGRLVLVVDQFEELFTTCADERERRAFIEATCAASRAADRATTPPLLTVLGIRADFYGHCMDYPSLVGVLRDAQNPVQPMTGEQLREVIEKPADAASLTLEDGLVDRLLQDLRAGRDNAGESGGTLPLLSYALLATWQHREGSTLTLAGYQATGGIWQAVTQQADRTYDGLHPTVQRAAELLLLRMVRLGEGTEDTRRRINVTDLLTARPADETAAIRTALDAFVRARLVTVADDTAEITHEALLRAWPRLRQWIDDDRAGLLVRQQLADAADAWDRAGREPTRLYAGTQLDNARQRFDDPRDRETLTPLAREFLDTSTRAARRSVRRRRQLISAGLVALLLVATGGTFAVQGRIAARDSQAVQSSQQLAAEADALRATDPATALQLSLAAYNSAPTPQARTSLYKSYATPYPTRLGAHTGVALAVAYAPNGHTVASTGQDRTIRLWNVDDPFHPRPDAAALPITGNALIAFSPDSRLLVAHTEQALAVWDVGDPTRPIELARVPLAEGGTAASPPAVAFGPDGKTLATSTSGGKAQLWDLGDPRHPAVQATWSADAQSVKAVAFSPDGHTLATAGAAALNERNSARVRLWDIGNRRDPAPRAALVVSSAQALAFNPVGRTLVSGGVLGDLHAWDVTDPEHPSDIQTHSVLNRASFNSVAFRPDGQGFATTDETGSAQFWTTHFLDRDDVHSVTSLADQAGLQAAAFSPDGQHLLTGDRNGAVDLWSMPVPVLPGIVNAGEGRGTTFNSKGTLLATRTDDPTSPAGVARLWEIGPTSRPVLAATLPRPWARASFLADDRMMLTEDHEADTLGLWNIADPRHPQAGATIAETDPAHATSQKGPAAVATNDNGLLAVSVRSGDLIQLWDIHDVQHPSLLTSIPLSPNPYDPAQAPDGLWFLDDTTLGVATHGDLHLWDLHDRHHPNQRGTVPKGGSGGASYLRSPNLLLAPDPADGPGTVVWNLANLDQPVNLSEEGAKSKHKPVFIDVRSHALARVNNRILAAPAPNSPLIQLWDLTNPSSPTAVDSIATTDKPNAIASSNDGHILAGNSSLGNTLRLWQVTGSDHPTLVDFADLPGSHDVVFSPDGHALAASLPTNGKSGILSPYKYVFTVWTLDTDSLYHQLCTMTRDAAADRDLQKYLPHQFYRPGCK